MRVPNNLLPFRLFQMARTFLPEMVERNSGHIVAISSMSALTGLANGSLYSSCKWAITGKAITWQIIYF